MAEYQGWTLDTIASLTYYQILTLLKEIGIRRYNEQVLNFQLIRYATSADSTQSQSFLDSLNPELLHSEFKKATSNGVTVPSELPCMGYKDTR